MATMKDGAHFSGLEGHQPFAYADTEIPLLSFVAVTFRPEN